MIYLGPVWAKERALANPVVPCPCTLALTNRRFVRATGALALTNLRFVTPSCPNKSLICKGTARACKKGQKVYKSSHQMPLWGTTASKEACVPHTFLP